MKRELTIMDPAMTEEQAKVLLFLVRLSRQPNQRARAHAAIAMTWNRDPDFELSIRLSSFIGLRRLAILSWTKTLTQ